MSDETLFPSIRIDDSLEGRLKAHGISKRNIRSIIHEVFSNENVQKLLRAEEDVPELDFTDARVTRSKQPQLEQDDYDIFSKGDDKFEQLTSDFQYAGDPNCGQNDSIESVLTTATSYEDTCDGNTMEFDWKKWLTEFADDGETGSESKDEEDSEDDPDFNFLAELEDPDEEDYRNDCATRISKKELKHLTLEKEAACTNVTPKKIKPLVCGNPSTITNDASEERTNQAISSYVKSKTLKEKLALLRSNRSLRKMRVKESKTKITSLRFNQSQAEMLRQQMQQHLQLLAQTAILGGAACDNQSLQYICELDTLKIQSPDPMNSYFNVQFLNDAINVAQKCTSDPPAVDIVNSAHQHTHKMLSEGNMALIANSRIFMYAELLPDFNQCKKRKKKWSMNEDSLIVHGLDDMSSCYGDTYDLIRYHLVPVHSREEILKRIRTVMNMKSYNSFYNPINRYKMLAVLPQPNKKVKYVSPTEVKTPVEMTGDLPSWVVNFKNKHMTEQATDMIRPNMAR